MWSAKPRDSLVLCREPADPWSSAKQRVGVSVSQKDPGLSPNLRTLVVCLWASHLGPPGCGEGAGLLDKGWGRRTSWKPLYCSQWGQSQQLRFP